MRMRMRITMKMMSPLSAKQLASERLLYPDELRGLQIGIHPIHKCIVCEGCQCCNHRELCSLVKLPSRTQWHCALPTEVCWWSDLHDQHCITYSVKTDKFPTQGCVFTQHSTIFMKAWNQSPTIWTSPWEGIPQEVLHLPTSPCLLCASLHSIIKQTYPIHVTSHQEGCARGVSQLVPPEMGSRPSPRPWLSH